MDVKKNNKRNFLKVSSILFFSLLSLDLNGLNIYKKIKKKGIRFYKKNKKIWILNQNDFE
tara:strand:+ start:409 stop:588 length:180 start_codon:yes stop_codon:yes gene_type:complete